MGQSLGYFIGANACLLAFYLFYKVFLDGTTFFRLNRFFLIGALLCSLTLPALKIKLSEDGLLGQILLKTGQKAETAAAETAFERPEKTKAEACEDDAVWVRVGDLDPVKSAQASAQTVSFVSDENPETENSGTDWPAFIFWLYCIVGFLVLSRFALDLRAVYRLAAKYPQEKKDGYVLVKMEGGQSAFSFGNKLFWDESAELSDIEKNQVLRHELAHIRQRHSLDILLFETAKAFFWINPVIYFYLISLKEQHEFLADRAVAEGKKDSHLRQYIDLMLGQTFQTAGFAAAHSFMQPQIKRRITMMFKNNTDKKSLLKYALAVPLAIMLAIVFSKVKIEASSRFSFGEGNEEETEGFYAAPAEIPLPEEMMHQAVWMAEEDSAKRKKATIVYQDEDLKMTLDENMKVKDLEVAGQKVPEAEYEKHRGLIDEKVGSIKGSDDEHFFFRHFRAEAPENAEGTEDFEGMEEFSEMAKELADKAQMMAKMEIRMNGKERIVIKHKAADGLEQEMEILSREMERKGREMEKMGREMERRSRQIEVRTEKIREQAEKQADKIKSEMDAALKPALKEIGMGEEEIKTIDINDKNRVSINGKKLSKQDSEKVYDAFKNWEKNSPEKGFEFKFDFDFGDDDDDKEDDE